MRLEVRITKPSRRVRNRWRDDCVTFECVVQRLIGPVRSGRGIPPYIYADIDLPDKYLKDAICTPRNPDGTHRVEVVVNHNRRSLAPFIASGDLEWDVRELP